MGIYPSTYTGTCDLTIKQAISVKQPGKNSSNTVRSKFIVLRDIDSLSLLKGHYISIRRLLEDKGVKVTFLHLPLYSIQHWNRSTCKGHPNPSVFKGDDKQITRYLYSVNKFLDDSNNEMNAYTPRLNEDLHRSRKSKKKHPRYLW